jgi:hypothetical protein
MHAERPAETDFAAGVREHCVTRRIANRLADAFENDQPGGRLPIVRQRQRRHGKQLQEVTEDGNRPKIAGAVRPSSRNEAQPVTCQFAQTGDDAHDGCAGRKQREKRAIDAARAFVGEVGEEAQDADGQNEFQRGGFFCRRLCQLSVRCHGFYFTELVFNLI